jgi:hypothetical protein
VTVPPSSRFRAVACALVALAGGCQEGLHVGAIDQARLQISGPAGPLPAMVGASQTVASLTVTNTGSKAAHAVAVSLDPATPPFKIAADLCTGGLLEPQGSCTVEIAAAPESAGTSQVTVKVAAAETAQTAVVQVAARGLEAALSADAGAPPAAQIGCQGPTMTISVVNRGNMTSRLLPLALSAGVASLPGTTCTPGLALEPGATCTISAAVKPVVEGLTTESVILAGTPGGTAEVMVETTGLPMIMATPIALYLVEVPNSPLPVGTIVISVGGTSQRLSYAIQGDTQEFFGAFQPQLTSVVVPTNCGVGSIIPACQTCSLDVTFRAPQAGTYAATLTVTGNNYGIPDAGVPVLATVALTGTL